MKLVPAQKQMSNIHMWISKIKFENCLSDSLGTHQNKHRLAGENEG
jgi:hypothetical protein